MSFESVWTHEKLWNKSKICIQKAFAEDREGDMFPFWAAIAIEMVARATLAKVHPVLLADPREGEHILYVFGFQKRPVYTPISIPTHTVFERCEVVVPGFTSTEKAFCREITTRRNEELHSGGLGFEGYSTKRWLSKYYKALKLLLEFQGKKLADLLGADEAKAADEMIKERDANLEKIIKDRIALHSKAFSNLKPEIQNEKVANIGAAYSSIRDPLKKQERCPSCGNVGIIVGKLISISDGKAGDAEIVQDVNALPTEFTCFCCDLRLENHLEMDVVEMGGQYKVEVSFDPMEYYNIEPEPDFDYGND